MLPEAASPAPPPTGFVNFCTRFADQCARTPGQVASIPLTEASWHKLAEVNASVNDSIWPEDDSVHYGRAEYWTIPTDGYGDCDDYALTKRAQLLAAGLPAAALRIAVADTPYNGRHAVLTVATDKGDFVLDNLRRDIVAWNATGYTWVERQSAADPLAWVMLSPNRPMLAAAAPSVGATQTGVP